MRKKKDTRQSAEAAVQLADEYNTAGDAPVPTTPVRRNVVAMLVEQYLQAIEGKARSGGRRLKWHEVGAIRMRISQGEKAEALEEVRNLGYTVDAQGMSW